MWYQTSPEKRNPEKFLVGIGTTMTFSHTFQRLANFFIFNHILSKANPNSGNIKR